MQHAARSTSHTQLIHRRKFQSKRYSTILLNEGKQYPRISFTAADLQNAVLKQAIVLLKSARGGGEHVETGERRQKDMKMHSPWPRNITRGFPSHQRAFSSLCNQTLHTPRTVPAEKPNCVGSSTVLPSLGYFPK